MNADAVDRLRDSDPIAFLGEPGRAALVARREPSAAIVAERETVDGLTREDLDAIVAPRALVGRDR